MKRRRTFGTIVSRRGSRNHYVRFHVPGHGRLERVGGKSDAEASRTLSRIEVLLADGTPLEVVLNTVFGEPLPGGQDAIPAHLTLRQAFKPYLEDSEGRRKTSTILGYRSIFDGVAKEPWSEQDLRRVDHRAIKAWIAKRFAAGVSGATLNRSMCALSSVFRWAIREGYADANPMARLQKYSEKNRGRETYLSSKEAWALVDAAGRDFRPLLLCALSTGMRKGELQRLTWGSVDLEAATLTVEPENTKTSKARSIRLGGLLLEALRPLASTACGVHATDLVFRTEQGRPFKDWEIRKRLNSALQCCDAIDAAKKEKVTMHVMRHTAASLMVAAGVPIFDVAKVLGHSTIAVTMKYAHFAPEAGRAAVETLDRMLRSGDPGSERVSEGSVLAWNTLQRAERRPPVGRLARPA